MANGVMTGITNVRRGGLNGPVMSTKIGDKVVGSGLVITSLNRNGKFLLPEYGYSGSYALDEEFVNWDEVTPPPDPEPSTFPEYFILTAPNGEQKRYNRV